MSSFKNFREALTLTVFVAGLGYFVDLFDIAIFGVVRISSLKALGLTDPAEILESGVHIYNMQMVGLMIGGVLWGLIADRKGRLSVMFGSILLYSLGNIANAFVWNVESYAFCRFITGIGLAGELGAAVTLVAESLPKHVRGYGTTIVATLGLSGSACAALVTQWMDWKSAYILGGVLGLCLLVARFKVRESHLFDELKPQTKKRDARLLFKDGRAIKYLYCILLGIPIYFTTGILFTFSPELTSGLNVQGTVVAGTAIFYGSVGLALGDLLSGLLSQALKSRKKAVLVCLAVAFICMCLYLFVAGLSVNFIYGICFVLGMAVGYWAVLITMAAEQFGTNIRGTVTTTVPNFVRGSAVLCTLGFLKLKQTFAVSQSAFYVGLICFLLAGWALYRLQETYGKDLNYLE